MSKLNAIKMLKAIREDVGFPIDMIIAELEKDEATDADIAVLGVSSVVFSLAERIDDLEAWRAKMEGKA
jgi:hypothetical protein